MNIYISNNHQVDHVLSMFTHAYPCLPMFTCAILRPLKPPSTITISNSRKLLSQETTEDVDLEPQGQLGSVHPQVPLE